MPTMVKAMAEMDVDRLGIRTREDKMVTEYRYKTTDGLTTT